MITPTTEQIRELCKMQTASTGRVWTSITELRQWIGGTRDEQDEALRQAEIDHAVQVIPIANLKAVSDADWDAALWHGGEWHHAIRPL